MTLFVVDVSRHQVERPNPLDLTRAKASGFGIANVQLDRGRQADELPSWALGYVTAARTLGMGISTYRWLDSRISGKESARRAFARILALGGPDGMAHAVDCEADATETHLREYVAEMQSLMGRRIAIYTGRWWMEPRGWRIRDMSPYLWAAPTAGYLTDYPGDNSPHWTVNYGGHTALDVMQFGVKPLPGTGDCSLSAIRDPKIWTALTGTKGGSMTYADPALIVARNYLLSKGWPGASVGIVGDQSHQSEGGYHVGNDVLAAIGKLNTDYSKRESDKDRPGSNAAMALDLGGVDDATLWDISSWLVAQCQAGAPDTLNIREIIYWHAPTNTIRRWDRLGIRSTGGWSHRTHTHLSYFRDSEGGVKDALFRRYYNPTPPPPPVPVPDSNNAEEAIEMKVYVFTLAAGGQPTRWGFGMVSAGEKIWMECLTDAEAVPLAIGLGYTNGKELSQAAFAAMRDRFNGVAAV